MKPVRPRQKGFTLIELLTVVATVGLLMAIAIPSFVGNQGKAFNARVENDARLAAIAQEAYFGVAFSYSSDCTNLQGFIPSEGVTFSECTATTSGFQLTADHPSATQTCSFDSQALPTFSCAEK